MKILISTLLVINLLNAATYDFAKTKEQTNKSAKYYKRMNTNLEYCSLDKNYKSKCINKKNQKKEIKND